MRHLGTDRLSWRDLKVIVHEAQEKSPIVRVLDPDVYLWGLQEQLLAEIADTLHWLKWAKTKDAQQKFPKNEPVPIPRPGIAEPEVEVYKFDVLPMTDMMSWLGWDSD